MPASLPLWPKIAYTLFVAVLVPIYWREHGPVNFLWFSDIALLVLVAALWLESALLVSMMAVAVLLPELVWNLDYFFRLATGMPLFGMTGYMFDASIPRYLRGLSLFHVVLPVLLVWMLYRLGYDSRALRWQTLVAFVVFPLSYVLSDAEKNVNWVHKPGELPQTLLPEPVYMVLVTLLFPLLVYVPTHVLLKKLFMTYGTRRLSAGCRSRTSP